MPGISYQLSGLDYCKMNDMELLRTSRYSHCRTTSTVAGCTESAKHTAEATEPNWRGIVAGDRGVGWVEDDEVRGREDSETGVGWVVEEDEGRDREDPSRPLVLSGLDVSEQLDDDDKTSCLPLREGRILPRFLPFITWLRMSLRSSGLNFSTPVFTMKCSSATR